MFARRHRVAQAFENAWTSRRRTDDARVRELVATAELLTRSATAEPDPAFQQELRTRLLTAAPSTMVAGAPDRTALLPATPPRRRGRVAAVLAAAALAIVGSVGASANAVPGDILYPVKLGTENVERTLARSDDARGRVVLEQATTRLAEAEVLSSQDASNARTRISSALDSFSEDALEGSALLLGNPNGPVDEQHAQEVADFADDSAARLSALLERLAPADRVSAERAVQALASLGVDLQTACPQCARDSQRVAQTVDQLLTDVQRTLVEEPAAPIPDPSAPPTPNAPVPTPGDQPPEGQLDTEAPSAPALPAPAEPDKGKPVIALPEPSMPTSLGDVVSPVVGIVLGDDRQVGLVPSLLGVLGLR
ncbi:hypothetical protein D9V41_07810 [Aeromicrobium phragmitis]|uniref:DUF5667 domain-containing protein n=1 Tax=Aeromicrobium phragmitis TaxID=2478914 RepID=A0A3L8PQL8_9ACTN|nr:DUF5667 domain-containing protein [Aeromicrobium phragmitis]RLV56322.1 hypothetical protein D9V41_07810 [Aeromicrobium phragmitis]